MSYTKRVFITQQTSKVPADLANFNQVFDLSTLDDDPFWDNILTEGELEVWNSSETIRYAMDPIGFDLPAKKGWIGWNGPISVTTGVEYMIGYGNTGQSLPADTDTYGKYNSHYNTTFKYQLQETPTGTTGEFENSAQDAYHATNTGSPTSEDFGISKGIEQTTATDKITIPSAANIGTVHTAYMILNLDSLATGVYMSGYDANALILSIVSGNLAYWLSSTARVSVSNPMSTSTDYLFSVRRDNTSVKFFINGVIVGTEQTLSENLDNFFQSLGANANDNFNMAGRYDFATIRTDAISDDEQLALYNNIMDNANFYGGVTYSDVPTGENKITENSILPGLTSDINISQVNNTTENSSLPAQTMEINVYNTAVNEITESSILPAQTMEINTSQVNIISEGSVLPGQTLDIIIKQINKVSTNMVLPGQTMEINVESVYPIPAAPTNPNAAPRDTKIAITWTAANYAITYNIYWGSAPGITGASSKIEGVQSGFVHTGRTNGQPYYYGISAINDAGESSLSDEVSAIPAVQELVEDDGLYLGLALTI